MLLQSKLFNFATAPSETNGESYLALFLIIDTSDSCQSHRALVLSIEVISQGTISIADPGT